MKDGPRDEVDRALANSMSEMAPVVADVDETLAALRPRMRGARLRRRVAQGSLVAAALLALGSAAAVRAADSSKGHVHVEAPSPDPGRSAATTPTTPVPTSTTPSKRAMAQQPAVTTPTTNAPGLPPLIAPPVTTPDHGSVPQGAGGPTSTPSPGNQSTPPVTAAPTRPGGLHTYRSAGGNVTVRTINGRLSLVSVTPASGYKAQLRTNLPDDIEVGFDNRTDEWRIRVRVENGAPVAEISPGFQWSGEMFGPPNQPPR